MAAEGKDMTEETERRATFLYNQQARNREMFSLHRLFKVDISSEEMERRLAEDERKERMDFRKRMVQRYLFLAWPWYLVTTDTGEWQRPCQTCRVECRFPGLCLEKQYTKEVETIININRNENKENAKRRRLM